MEDFTTWKKLADKKRYTADEKALIESAAAEIGVTLNKRCPNCYNDVALEMALRTKPKEPQTEGEYELYDDIDMVIDSYKFGRLVVCPKNCTPVNARKWIEAGLPLRFFKKYPHGSNE